MMRFVASNGASDEEIRRVEEALLRAAKSARRLSALTRTPFVYVKDGVIVKEVPPLSEAFETEDEGTDKGEPLAP